MMILLQLISIIPKLIPLPRPTAAKATERRWRFLPIHWTFLLLIHPVRWSWWWRDEGGPSVVGWPIRCQSANKWNDEKLFPGVVCRLIRISALLINYLVAFVHQHKRRLILWTLYIYLCSTIAGQLNYNKSAQPAIRSEGGSGLELTGRARTRQADY